MPSAQTPDCGTRRPCCSQLVLLLAGRPEAFAILVFVELLLPQGLDLRRRRDLTESLYRHFTCLADQEIKLRFDRLLQFEMLFKLFGD